MTCELCVFCKASMEGRVTFTYVKCAHRAHLLCSEFEGLRFECPCVYITAVPPPTRQIQRSQGIRITLYGRTTST